MSELTVAQPESPRQACVHLRAFIDFYLGSLVLVISAPIGTPVIASCQVCENEPPQMLDDGVIEPGVEE